MSEWDSLYTDAKGYRRWPNEALVSWVCRNYEVDRVENGLSALDIGCGIGNNSWFLHDCGFDVVAIDTCELALEMAPNFVSERCDGVPQSVEFDAQDIRQTDFHGAQFDLAVDATCLQHLTKDDHAKALAEIHRILVPGGRLFSYRLASGTDYAGIFPGNPPVWLPTRTELAWQLDGAGFSSKTILRQSREYPHHRWAEYFAVEATK